MEQTSPTVDATRSQGVRSTHADAEQLGFLNLYRVYHLVLDADENEVLRLVEVERRGHGEIARRMARTTDEIKSLVFAARRKLYMGMRQTLAELGRPSVA